MLSNLFEIVKSCIAEQLFDDDTIGEYGEMLTERELRLVSLFGRKGKVLKNLYLPKEDGGTSEIDLVYITKKGIFVIERQGNRFTDALHFRNAVIHGILSGQCDGVLCIGFPSLKKR